MLWEQEEVEARAGTPPQPTTQALQQGVLEALVDTGGHLPLQGQQKQAHLAS